MAKIVEETKSFPRDPLDKDLLFKTIKKYKPEGLELGVEKVSKPYLTSFGKYQMTVQLTIMADDIKSFQYELDENAQYIMTEDEFGDEMRKFKVASEEDTYLATATLFLNLSCKEKEIDEETTVTIYPTSGSYPLFKSALQANNDLPEDMKKVAFETCGKELAEALEGFTFKGVVKKATGKFKFEYLGVVVDE